jgi:hypothetical protein
MNTVPFARRSISNRSSNLISTGKVAAEMIQMRNKILGEANPDLYNRRWIKAPSIMTDETGKYMLQRRKLPDQKNN